MTIRIKQRISPGGAKGRLHDWGQGDMERTQEPGPAGQRGEERGQSLAEVTLRGRKLLQ